MPKPKARQSEKGLQLVLLIRPLLSLLSLNIKAVAANFLSHQQTYWSNKIQRDVDSWTSYMEFPCHIRRKEWHQRQQIVIVTS
jgi:hypothetical protein